MRARHLEVVRRHTEWVSKEAVSAETEALRRDCQDAVVAALGDLPERQREVLMLRYWAHLKEPEIATTLGIRQGTVKSHTARGTATLFNRLDAYR